jgi:hypothetical protein
MQIIDTKLHDVKLIRPKIHHDDRGWAGEVFNAQSIADLGLSTRFVQDNQSFSKRGAEGPALSTWPAAGQVGACAFRPHLGCCRRLAPRLAPVWAVGRL